MYEQYWELRTNPFLNNTDAGFFFRSDTHEAALLKLRYVAENRLQCGLLSGEIGSGKTFLVRLLAEDLGEEFSPVAHLVFPRLTAGELISWLAVELGVDEAALSAAPAGLDHTLRLLQQRIGNLNAEEKHPVAVIDEAQLIDDPQVLTAIQLLLNFQQVSEIEFTLFLVGEPSLLGQVRRVAALDERTAVRSILQPFSFEETADYVNFRLETAGAHRPLFNNGALRSLFELSGGIPRRINRLCDMSLLVGFADQLNVISENEVRAVADELMARPAAA